MGDRLGTPNAGDKTKPNDTDHFFFQLVRLLRLVVVLIRGIIRWIRRHVADAVLLLQVALQLGQGAERERWTLRADEIEHLAALNKI